MKYFFKALQNYATFDGRATRSEFWGFMGLQLLVYIVLLMMYFQTLSQPNDKLADLQNLGIFAAAYSSVMLLPWLAVSVRRLHDIGKSAWFLLVYLIPITGEIIFLVFMLTPGTRGENEYGPDPQRSE